MSRNSNERQAFDLLDSPISHEARRPNRPDRRKPPRPLTSFRPLALALIAILLLVALGALLGGSPR